MFRRWFGLLTCFCGASLGLRARRRSGLDVGAAEFMAKPVLLKGACFSGSKARLVELKAIRMKGNSLGPYSLEWLDTSLADGDCAR